MSKEYHFSTKSSNAYNSLLALKTISLESGDKILLERGSVFNSEYIHLKGLSNITISSYGDGEKPIINAKGEGIWYQDYGCELDSPTHRYCGNISSTIHLEDCSNITITNLEIINDKVGDEYYCATGVSAVARNIEVMSNIVLEDLFIHDVYGNIYDKHLNNGGIYFTCSKPSKNTFSRFENILISKCFVYRTSRWGIAIGYTYAHENFKGTKYKEDAFKVYGHKNVRIENCYVKQAAGDAITVMYSDNPIVNNNLSDEAACQINDRYYLKPHNRGGKVGAGIWPWKCLNAEFRNNLARTTRLNQDGMAYDADSGWSTLYEHNFSSLNEGGTVMFCLEEAIDSSFINNVIDDDLGGIFSMAKNPNGLIRDNVINKKVATPLFRKRMDDGNVKLENNIIREVK